MGDLEQFVSDLLETLKEWKADALEHSDDKAYNAVNSVIQHIEGMVEENDYYSLFTNVNDELPNQNTTVLVQTLDENMMLGFNDEDEQWRDFYFEKIDDVIAWMPLPKPYECDCELNSKETRKENE